MISFRRRTENSIRFSRTIILPNFTSHLRGLATLLRTLTRPIVERILPRLTLFALLALAACTSSDTGLADAGPPDSSGWRLPSGKSPSQAEFAALAATCQDKGGETAACFTNLGLKRAQ